MSIDYREFFAGQCYGTISCADEGYGADQVCEDIDVELSESMDQELFGSVATIGTKRKKISNAMDNLKSLHNEAKKIHSRKKTLRASIIKSPKSTRKIKRKAMFALRRDLAKIKSKMQDAIKDITSTWRKSKSAFKKEWRKHNKGVKKTPAHFISQYGPHKFQG
jgi:predicted  nucleic acid-binding Zn-ribbon protein